MKELGVVVEFGFIELVKLTTRKAHCETLRFEPKFVSTMYICRHIQPHSKGFVSFGTIRPFE